MAILPLQGKINMNVVQYLEEGAAAVNLLEEVVTAAEPTIEKFVADAGNGWELVQKLWADAKSEFETLKTSGVAGTSQGENIGEFVEDITYMFGNVKDILGNDAVALANAWTAASAQWKSLTAQSVSGAALPTISK